MDVDDYLAQEQESARTSIKQKNVYECDVEGCNAAFIKFGNYINHIVTNDHPSIAEKLSLKDAAMRMYHSKLEKVENRRIISTDVNLTKAIADEMNLLTRGWALPTRKPNTEYSDKQRGYLQKRFDEGVSDVKHWKPKEVVFEMKTLKKDGKFYFSASELLNESQVRSFFCRLKRDREVTGTRQVPTNNPIIKDNALKNYSNDNDDEDVDSELEVLEQDFQDTEIAVEEVKILESFNINVKIALESSLSMNS